jgi:elongation factor P
LAVGAWNLLVKMANVISLNQARVGSKIIFREAPYEVIDASHLKMGRGGAKLVTKLRNLLTQTVIDYTFAGDERLELADLVYRNAQFLYRENDQAFFMTNDDYETLSLALPEARTRFLKEGEAVDLLLWADKPIDIRQPAKVTLKVTYTEPGFKGNTTSSVLKPATLETGAIINVPLFVNIGDFIVVNTETAQYAERA